MKHNETQTHPLNIFIIVLVPVFLICGLLLWIPAQLNTLRLMNFAESLYNYPLPQNTAIINQHAEISKVGNGNNCWYKVEQTMVSTLQRTEIKEYYENVNLPRVSFEHADATYNISGAIEIELTFDENMSNETKSFFTLTLFDVGSDTTLDFRCH